MMMLMMIIWRSPEVPQPAQGKVSDCILPRPFLCRLFYPNMEFDSVHRLKDGFMFSFYLSFFFCDFSLWNVHFKLRSRIPATFLMWRWTGKLRKIDARETVSFLDIFRLQYECSERFHNVQIMLKRYLYLLSDSGRWGIIKCEVN